MNSRSSVSGDVTARWLWKRWASCSVSAFPGVSTAADVPYLNTPLRRDSSRDIAGSETFRLCCVSHLDHRDSALHTRGQFCT